MRMTFWIPDRQDPAQAQRSAQELGFDVILCEAQVTQKEYTIEQRWWMEVEIPDDAVISTRPERIRQA